MQDQFREETTVPKLNVMKAHVTQSNDMAHLCVFDNNGGLSCRGTICIRLEVAGNIC